MFLVLSSVKNLSRQFVRLNEVFWHLLWHYKIISVTPKRFLKTQFFEKKANFPVKKISLSFFPRSIEHEKYQGSINMGQEGLLTNIKQDMVLILKDLRGWWKHNFLKKESNVSHEKKLVTNFSLFIECDKPQGSIYQAAWRFLTFIEEL